MASSAIGGSVMVNFPVGMVVPFAGTTAPAGFLLCNGAAISRSAYSKLFEAIGTAHGSGDGSTTFHLPDYRGRFLRGTDGGVARDPDRASRTAANSGGNTGDAVGSVQGNATAKNGLGASNPAVNSGNESSDHSHGYSDYNWQMGSFEGVGGIQGGSGVDRWNVGRQTGGRSAAHIHTTTTAVSLTVGDSETRPVNANVNYIIKI